VRIKGSDICAIKATRLKNLLRKYLWGDSNTVAVRTEKTFGQKTHIA